jgi:hypothetical protein
MIVSPAVLLESVWENFVMNLPWSQFQHSRYRWMYSRIPLIQCPCYWTGTGLSNIPDARTVPIVTQVLRGNLLLLFPCFGCETNHRSTVLHLDISPTCWLFQILELACGECALVDYFHLVIKDLALSITIGLVMGFPSECLGVNHWQHHVQFCHELLGKVFYTLTWCHKWQ